MLRRRVPHVESLYSELASTIFGRMVARARGRSVEPANRKIAAIIDKLLRQGEPPLEVRMRLRETEDNVEAMYRHFLKPNALRERAEYVGVGMGLGGEGTVSSPQLRRLVQKYNRLERKIQDRYERGLFAGALEAQAAAVLEQIEGLYAALIEEGEPQVEPVARSVEVELAEAWQRMLDSPESRRNFEDFIARGRRPEVKPARWVCTDLKRWGQPDCPRELVPESFEWPYIAQDLMSRLHFWERGTEVNMNDLIDAAEEAWLARQQLIGRIQSTKTRRTSRKTPLEEAKSFARRVTRKRRTSRVRA